MGWASGSSAFDNIAYKLINGGTPPETITEVLAAVIEEFTEMDWHTLDESIDEFRNNPAVMAAFRQAAPSWMQEYDEINDVENVELYNQVCWIAARLAWHSSDLVFLIKKQGTTKEDLLTAQDHPMGSPKIAHIEDAVAKFRELFPNLKTLDDARKQFGVGV